MNKVHCRAEGGISMRPLDGLRDVFLFALSHSKYTYAEKVVLTERWNDAVHELEKHYDIKSKPEPPEEE